jgi:hypothetical protein
LLVDGASWALMADVVARTAFSCVEVMSAIVWVAMVSGARHHALHADPRQYPQKERSCSGPERFAYLPESNSYRCPRAGTQLRRSQHEQPHLCLYRGPQTLWCVLAKSAMHRAARVRGAEDQVQTVSLEQLRHRKIRVAGRPLTLNVYVAHCNFYQFPAHHASCRFQSPRLGPACLKSLG